jgi:hypothetical protein
MKIDSLRNTLGTSNKLELTLDQIIWILEFLRNGYNIFDIVEFCFDNLSNYLETLPEQEQNPENADKDQIRFHKKQDN